MLKENPQVSMSTSMDASQQPCESRGELVLGGRSIPIVDMDGQIRRCVLEERLMGGKTDIRHTKMELYSVAGQTVFHIYGVNGAPSNCFESYPGVPLVDGESFDRAFSMKRTKAEYEAEQTRLRR